MKHGLDGVAQAIGTDDSNFRPITIDMGPVVKNGSVTIHLANRLKA
jgi:hypothetical protein